MSIHEKIRSLREINSWTQEEMAEKLEISKNGYAKLERGESKLNIERLEQIANIFNVDIADLASDGRGLVCFINGDNSDNSQNNISYYTTTDALIAENEKLKLTLEHNATIIEQKDKEISMLKEMVELLKQK